MSLQACADLVARGDPDRFRAAMAAPVDARRVLFPLYAFNVEVTRAPWVSQEPMIAQMRLQFWRDVLDEIGAGQAPRAHEVADQLGFLDNPACAWLDELVVARHWDIERAAFADEADFARYLDQTSGHLTWVAARALGAPDAAETVIRGAAWAAGLASYLRAVPELESRGRVPLVDGRPEAVAALAEAGLRRLASAWAQRRAIPGPAVHALRAGIHAGPLLRLARQAPGRVGSGQLHLHPVTARLVEMRSLVTGRWSF